MVVLLNHNYRDGFMFYDITKEMCTSIYKTQNAYYSCFNEWYFSWIDVLSLNGFFF